MLNVPKDLIGDDRLSHVLSASERLTCAASVEEVVAVLRDTARAAVGAEGIAVVIENEGRCSYVAEDAVSPLWQGQSFLIDHCVSGWTMRHGETVAIRDVWLDPRIPQDAYAPTFVRSLVMVPIGRPVPFSALGAYWSDVRDHDPDTIKLLESLARLATIAIENARLTQARNRGAALRTTQNRILELAVEVTTLNVTLDAIVREVEALSTSGFVGSIVLLDEDMYHVEHCASPSLPDAYTDALKAMAVAPFLGYQSALTAVADIMIDPRWSEFRDLAVGHGLLVCWSVPIRSAQGALLGAFVLYHRELRKPLPADIEIINFVAHTVGLIVHRARTDSAIRISESRLRLAVDHADVGFWDVDLVHDTLVWPSQTKAMFGISANVKVTLQDFYDGLHPEDRDATIDAFLAAADPERRALYEVDYRTVGREDGIVRWIAAKGRGVFNAAGVCLRVTGTAIEITARKAAEEELRELNDTLERRIVQAIAEREEVQQTLRQSQKMEAMGQLTGGVAHDFNNLLTPIVGTLDLLLRRGVGGDREQRLISGAMQSAERAKTLVQRLLAFARRQPLQTVPVDVAKLLSDMGDLVARTAGPKIKVVVDAPENLPAAIADQNQLEMAVLNLSVNARDAMIGGGTLCISAGTVLVGDGHRSKLPKGEYLCLTVADTGTGMDAATLGRAVEPFFSTKGVGKGTGLGLSMVHGLASQLNGALTIQSSPGFGTKVELWLPRSMTVPAAALHIVEASEPQLTRGIALLVDDEELVRASTCYMLAELGYRVIEAGSGEEAMQLIANGQAFDLLITDHLMPGINGTDLARVVRSSRPGTAVLLVSGYAEREGLDPDLPRLTKPFRKSELAACLAPLHGKGGGPASEAYGLAP
ncbi:Two-component sensor histidine kinase [Pseudomonas syringae pv. maculicola]|uniref:histidine kinase n=1 Tax=Pseudomonas savastanoi pv. glycinea TaxID=318 RepID=A0A3M3G999_PSESG|nr:ATP-binding protein [Pseudomonas savastanoi]KPB35300.1 Two-component sensor histidine kinase [Pseudomonas savastanoi pv. phaseolicola]KPB87851.1 Two-component sensor histidine kinase [Pseudomonas syringae pv. maculicola]RMM70465.1 Two-component sensor histidine kinase [Pseudomonas savastanoi pv. glycinea]RMO14077.1 Two-component sensor histidine kinase [Pseudomonas savastanoi pv. phaseolicola]RMQ57170.1 Two-component sensor histidine kinase [Pseudomonas savastanoi pv. phaseolicola]